MHSTLLATKLFIPPAAPDRIDRLRLLQLLDAGLTPGHPLILVCAPAGYGKTTLLSEWIASHRNNPITFSWFSLEASDDSPARFFAYLAAALDKAIPGMTALLDDLLAAPQFPGSTELAAAFINPLTTCKQTLVILLDDYQVIHDGTLHTALSFLIEHLPPQVHLALASRSDPPLPLHRLRARGQLIELRLHDLRFDREETNRLFVQAGGAHFNEAEISLLEEHTEGWAAGLRMALLSIRGKGDFTSFFNHFTGSRRYILDYLAEEVFKNQSEELQSFLLQTAGLERLCAPLCNALTGRTNGQECLTELERANCFLISLDEERTWFRYHHLFADLLRVRLKQRTLEQPDAIKGLHQRAAEWLETNDYSEEAVQHSLLAGDFDRAARIVEQNTLNLFARGKLHPLLSWIHLLPAELAEQRPWLNIYQAWALAFAARLPEAERHLSKVENIPVLHETSVEENARIKTEIRAIRSFAAVTGGSLQSAIALTNLPADNFPAQPTFARSVQRWSLGYALRMKGDLTGAEACFEDVLHIGYELDNLWTIITASVDLGAILRQKGELQRAEAVYRAGLKRATQAYGGPGYIGRLEAFLASLLLERGERDEARRLIEQAIRHNRQWENPNHCAYAWMIQAHIALVEGRHETVQDALREADAWVKRGPVVPPLRSSIEATHALFWLKTGLIQQAIDWLEQHPFSQPGSKPPEGEMADAFQIIAARILLAAGKPDVAHPILLNMEQEARRSAKNNILLETLLLLTQTSPDPATALTCLREALSSGLSRGYRQMFLNVGEQIINQLEACQDISGVVDLLAELRQVKKETGECLLTAREIEILRWMASGLSNPQIGARLYISAGTVKAHSAAIYRKMNVANRAEAIARAKDLGYL